MILAGPAMAAQFTGALQTTTSTGTAVNANLYATKPDVYLTGGPQNTNAMGLPDGTYYFQVTDPNGTTLLSDDPAVCRQVVVTGGVIVHSSDGANQDGLGCSHILGTFNNANGEQQVQVGDQPNYFNDTPNQGGVYKLWLIAQSDTGVKDNTGKSLCSPTFDQTGLYIPRGRLPQDGQLQSNRILYGNRLQHPSGKRIERGQIQ
jgi:hypothetical protein